MYNNKCIVSGDEPQAEMAFEISGDREYARNFETPEEAEIGAEAVADLLPLKDVASPEAIRTAKKIVNLYLNPKTGDIADKVLSSLIVRGKVDDEAKDAVYATKRVANAVVRKWGDKIGWDKIGAFEIGRAHV